MLSPVAIDLQAGPQIRWINSKDQQRNKSRDLGEDAVFKNNADYACSDRIAGDHVTDRPRAPLAAPALPAASS